MKSVFAALMFGSMTILALPSSAQRVKLAEGDLKPLAGQKEINLEFVYSDMKVGKMSEADYVKKKKDEYNKKEAGKGDAWEKAWMEDRETRYEANHAQPNGTENHHPHIGLLQIGQQQCWYQNRQDDDESAHGWRSLLLLFALQAQVANRFTHLLLPQVLN